MDFTAAHLEEPLCFQSQTWRMRATKGQQKLMPFEGGSFNVFFFPKIDGRFPFWGISVQFLVSSFLQQFAPTPKLGGGNSNIFYFHPGSWGRFPILTSIFQLGWNHQLAKDLVPQVVLRSGTMDTMGLPRASTCQAGSGKALKAHGGSSGRLGPMYI